MIGSRLWNGIGYVDNHLCCIVTSKVVRSNLNVWRMSELWNVIVDD